jgi:hypothetical protein
MDPPATLVESLLFAAPDVSDLKLPVKHYTSRTAETAGTQRGYTLFFAHASGMHKEQWEPVIAVLLANPSVHDAWSFDWPSHGEGAVVNAQTLSARDKPMCRPSPVFMSPNLISPCAATTEWADLLEAFYTMYKFTPQTTIAIGHSNGASALYVCAFTDEMAALHDFNRVLSTKRSVPDPLLYDLSRARDDTVPRIFGAQSPYRWHNHFP